MKIYSELDGLKTDSGNEIKPLMRRIRSLHSKMLGKHFDLNELCKIQSMANQLFRIIHAEAEAINFDPDSINRVQVETLIRILKKIMAELLPSTAGQYLLMLKWLRSQRRRPHAHAAMTQTADFGCCDLNEHLPRRSSSRDTQ